MQHPHVLASASTHEKMALLIIAMINNFDFDGADELLPKAEKAAERLAVLKVAAKTHDVPIIYVNDNYGHWDSDFRSTVRRAQQGKGRRIAELLEPVPGDYSVVKPRNSGFFATPLAILLEHLSVERTVLGGIATNLCVLHTVRDACLHGFKVTVVEDGVAAEDDDSNDFTLRQMEKFLRVDVKHAEAIDLIP